MFGKAYKCPQMKTMKFLVHESLSSEGFAHGQGCRCTTAYLDCLVGSFVKKWNSWFLRCEGWKGLQMSPNEYHEILGHESFEFGGVCPCPWLAVHHGIGRWLDGEFCEKMKFVVFDMWGLEWPTNVPKWIPWNSWCTKVLSSERFAHGQGCRRTTTQLDCLVGSFVKKWNSWFLICEGWKGLQMSPNEYHEILGARKFEFGGVCTWPRLSVHHGITWLLGGEFCEKMRFVVFEMWGLEMPTNVSKWIPWNYWCTKVLSSDGFAHGQGCQCTTTKLDCLVGSFVKKWNSWFLRCEGWNGLQMSPNEYH